MCFSYFLLRTIIVNAIATMSVMKALQQSILHTILPLIHLCSQPRLQKDENEWADNLLTEENEIINDLNCNYIPSGQSVDFFSTTPYHDVCNDPFLFLHILVEWGHSLVPRWDAPQETSAELSEPFLLLHRQRCCGLAPPAALQQQQLWPWGYQAADCSAFEEVS